MSDRRVRKAIVTDQRGIALVVTLLALVLLLVLALGALQSSIASLRTAANDRMTKAALAIAEGGAEYARETLRIDLRGGATLSQRLNTASNNSNLVDATMLSSFHGSTGLVNNTINIPYIGPTNFGSGTFQVFLTNDRVEPGAASQSASVTSKVDTNKRIMVTSFGSGPGGSLAAVQEQLKMFDAFLAGPSLPGVIVLPGPTVNFQSFNSNARQVNGDDASSGMCLPTIAVSTNAAKRLVDHTICSARPSGYASCAPFAGNYSCDSDTNTYIHPATENFLPTASNPYDAVSANTPPLAGDPRLISVAYLNNLAAQVQAVADFKSTSDAGFTYGDTNNPKIVAINGDLTISGNTSGAGVLLVTGTLTLNGTPSYNGVILVIGDGVFQGNGNGNGTIAGSLLIANTHTPWSVNPKYVGIPTYDDNGGGNSSEQYDSSSLTKYAAGIMPLQLISFQALR